MVNVVELHAVYLFISCYLGNYCKYLLKLKDNTIITTLQASSNKIACTQGCGLKQDWS